MILYKKLLHIYWLLRKEKAITPMTEIEKLKDGVYEKVMSRRFAEVLKEALAEDQVRAEEEDVDAEEAVGYLSSYLQRVIRLCLKDIADRGEENSVDHQLALTNELIASLAKKTEELGGGQEVANAPFLLRSLEHKKNTLLPRRWERPATSLTRSFLFTNSKKDVSMVHELTKEIASSDRIDFLISFIRFSGLQLLLPALRLFTARGGHLRIVTTTYMGATDPKAIEVLASLPHTEVRISYDVKETRLHAKSYMFYRESGYSTAYIGSSNLSHAAIAEGMEWNMKVTAQDQPHIIDKMSATFETYWHSEDFTSYEPQKDEEKLRRAIDRERGRSSGTDASSYAFDIQPYPYQQAILDALDTERHGKDRWYNLVVAATGTGKTAISAFDYRRFAASRKEGTRLLFIAHREEILKQSLSCFRQVMKDPDFGALAVGGHRASHVEHLFMSIQTLNSQRFFEKMDPYYYDMIIVDEFHHAAARSYQHLLTHFHPKILLGLTATPERMDGGDILSYFGGHIAAEIRLPDAIERRLLCPFHYFGVTDPVSLAEIKWTGGEYDASELERLYTAEGALASQRARAIGDALLRYTADIRDVKALGFCVSKKHAHFMADYFNQHGIPALALDADTPAAERNAARERLAEGELRILFVVDLFNEGVDIPSVNTVLFLRPTNSMTVFLQQLGRGLRLSKGKDCLTVLDFVAQASRKYDFSRRFASLLGKHHVIIKKEIQEGFPHVPKGCAIQLEEQAQKWVLENIASRLRKNEYYIEMVKELYAATGSRPTLSDFFRATQVEPAVFYNGTRTYTRLLMDAEILPALPVTDLEEALRRSMSRTLTIDSPRWISFLRRAYENLPINPTPMEKKYLRMWAITLFPDGQKDSPKDPALAITRFAKETALKEEISELLDFLYDRIDIIPPKAELPYPCALEVYDSYTRDQLFAALGFAKPASIREGVKYLDHTNSDTVTRPTDVFLVTLNKSQKEFSDTTLYEDYSIDRHLFHWQSQSTTTPESKTGQRYLSQRETGGIVLLFVRSAKQDACRNAMAYTFLGTAKIVSHEGSQPISIIYRLDHPIPAKYITKTDSSGVL